MQLLNASEIAFNDQHNYYGGAIGHISYNLVSSLVKETDIHLTTFATGTDLEEPVPDGLEIRHVDGYDEIEEEFETAVDDVDPDVLTHFYFYEPSSNPVFNRRQPLDKPLVVGMCELPHSRNADEVDGIERFQVVRTLGRKVLLPRFKRTIQACDKLIVVNEAAKEYYAEYIPADRIEVIPYGVDVELFQPTPLPDDHRVLMVSRLIKRRGIRYAIDALQMIRGQFPDAELDLVGDGPQRETLRSLAEERGVSDAVTFHGNVGPEDLVQRYQSATVYCHLSNDDGWNQTALEAMASARPVVAVDAPHNSMVVDRETGMLIPPADSEALAVAINELFNEPNTARQMGGKGRAGAEREYDWGKVARKYAESLHSVS